MYSQRKIFIPLYTLIHMVKNNKVRVNISVDKDKLEKAKTKLNLFGGKLSTLFNVYLSDFVESMNQNIGEGQKEMTRKIKELELKIEKIEEKLNHR